MLVKRSNVLTKGSLNDELKPRIEKDAIIIDGDFLLERNDPEWTFYKFTDKLSDGTPVVDLDLAERFDAVFYLPENVDLEWLMSATLLEIIQRYSKGAYEN
ncbi:hypothetical protein HYI36_26580 [Bacillus sp. Gen3]|nr:hypothetical protein [Bacillus sp. Gen3]